MPKSSPCVFPWSSLWLASLATLVVQSVLSSSYSSSSTYQRPAAGGKRPGFMERTLILLDVNTRSPIRVLNDNFLSLQLDPSIIKDGWLDFLRVLSAPVLHDIVRSDIALDKQKGCKLANHPDIMLELQREKAATTQLVLLKEQLSNIYSNITITARSLDKLYNFADCAGLHLILGLNALHRNPDNSWNTSSTLSLLKYGAGKKYNISWELGNEPNAYRSMVGRAVNSTQLAQDYNKLRTLLQSVRYYHRAHLYGPNAGRPRKNAILLLDGWVNTLGMAAMQGIDVVLRHSFFDYGYTHLVDQHFNPLPDYWFSLVFKRLVGPRVLAVRVAGLQRKPQPGRVIRDKLRIYAHCTSYYKYVRQLRHLGHNYVRGSITIYIINLHRSRKKIKLAGTLRNNTVHQYLLQPYGTDGLRAKHVQLNGEKLLMVDNETFPELKPKTLRAGRTIAMPPMTIGFYVIKNINAYACRR
ncbi:Inactive heparanase-2 [Collichthys lucidus]|uniref:Inactive heparanase-2 n=1 Tax=Collichthys lucidus TaxID=240159 RepID=A0A4V6XYX8_COLLU|nr:Inactive heparanase-2 [Collichthys lucidus]